MGRRKKSGLVYFLLLAAVFHAWLLQQPVPSALQSDGVPPRLRAPVEVFSQRDLNVVQTLPPESNLPKKDRARFAGERDQRTERETKSPLAGPLRDGGGRQLGRPTPDESDPKMSEDADAMRAPKGGLGLADLLALASSPNRLPDDIALGDRTVLNTDAVVYASFLNRIAEEIYQPWVEYARGYVELMYMSGSKLQARTYVTKLGIQMDDLGNLLSVHTLKSSGVELLDEAPKRAFWDREPFKNPPGQMRKKDGTLRFVYEFHFEWRTSSFSIVPWAI